MIAKHCPNKPKKKKDSFLFLTFHHVAALQKEGLMVWNSLRDELVQLGIFFYLTTADGPGSVYLTCLVGHSGACLCQLFCGMKGQYKPGVSHYYPALLKLNDYNVEGCNHPDLKAEDIRGSSMQDYNQKLTYVLESRNIKDHLVSEYEISSQVLIKAHSINLLSMESRRDPATDSILLLTSCSIHPVLIIICPKLYLSWDSSFGARPFEPPLCAGFHLLPKYTVDSILREPWCKVHNG